MSFARSCLPRIFAGLVGLSAPGAANSAEANLTAPGTHEHVSFSQYPSIAESEEVISRMLSPIALEEVHRKLKASGKALQARMFDIRNEKFVIYVPAREPAAGYGLLVFVPPWTSEQIPTGWRSVLDHYGVIFISASGSGNEAGVLDRRIPLALAGLANIRALFRVDPTRTLIGGFSGGSRVAMRMALAYPDIFSGVLLNAGSDPIGVSPAHFPAPDLFLRFQTRTRVVFVTGDQDEANQSLDSSSRSSMLHWCVANTSVRGVPASHEVASASALDRAFGDLFANTKREDADLEACRAAKRQEVSRAIARVQGVVESGDRPRARRMLFDLDVNYGGLAAPQSITLADRCGCGIFDSTPANQP